MSTPDKTVAQKLSHRWTYTPEGQAFCRYCGARFPTQAERLCAPDANWLKQMSYDVSNLLERFLTVKREYDASDEEGIYKLENAMRLVDQAIFGSHPEELGAVMTIRLLENE